MDISVQESDLLARLPCALDLADDSPAEGDEVKGECGYRVDALLVGDRKAYLMDEDGDERVQ